MNMLTLRSLGLEPPQPLLPTSRSAPPSWRRQAFSKGAAKRWQQRPATARPSEGEPNQAGSWSLGRREEAKDIGLLKDDLPRFYPQKLKMFNINWANSHVKNECDASNKNHGEACSHCSNLGHHVSLTGETIRLSRAGARIKPFDSQTTKSHVVHLVLQSDRT